MNYKFPCAVLNSYKIKNDIKSSHRVFLHSRLHFLLVLYRTPRHKQVKSIINIASHHAVLVYLSQTKQKTTLISGFFCLRNFPAPVTVPPVPIPATNASTFPLESFHISGPVVS